MMRQLSRPKVLLPTLSDSGKGAAKAVQHADTRVRAPGVDLDWPDHWNEPDVRGALHAMQGWACAYCQRLLENHRGYVDHFRPKRGGKAVEHEGYWWLGYVFENYVLACGVCNSSCKISQFPLVPGERRVEYGTRAALATEARLLIDPVADPVDVWMRVEWRPSAGAGIVKLHPLVTEGTLEEQRVSRTIGLFRVNEDIEVYRPRLQAILEAGRAVKRGDRDKVRRLACRYLPNGAAVHGFLREVYLSWLPAPDEELRILLEEIERRLRDACLLLKRFPASDHCQRDIEEALWTFAVLWKAPPPGTLASTDIEQWLDRRRLSDLVRSKYTALGSSAAPLP
jgi:uncharacterized protein (TIGR02646 family)